MEGKDHDDPFPPYLSARKSSEGLPFLPPRKRPPVPSFSDEVTSTLLLLLLLASAEEDFHIPLFFPLPLQQQQEKMGWYASGRRGPGSRCHVVAVVRRAPPFVACAGRTFLSSSSSGRNYATIPPPPIAEEERLFYWQGRENRSLFPAEERERLTALPFPFLGKV